MDAVDALRLFGLNNLSIESDICRVEAEQRVDLGHLSKKKAEQEQQFYPQFSEKLREEADAMAAHFAIFYCLENSIRELISNRLEEIHGEDWWELAVPPNVKENATKNRSKEVASGVTLRSELMIDYSNFGELGEILKANWTIFGDTLRDISAVQKILGKIHWDCYYTPSSTLRYPGSRRRHPAACHVVRNVSVLEEVICRRRLSGTGIPEGSRETPAAAQS